MKGIVFNLLEEYITDVLGEDAYDAIVGECDLITREPFIGPGTYPDEDLVEIITKASDAPALPDGETPKPKQEKRPKRLS
mgnify:CR=1 FL=1